MKEPIRLKQQKDEPQNQLARYCLYDGDTYVGTYTAPEIAERIGCAKSTVSALACVGSRYRSRWLVDRLAEDEMNHRTDRILALAEEWDHIRLKLLKTKGR